MVNGDTVITDPGTLTALSQPKSRPVAREIATKTLIDRAKLSKTRPTTTASSELPQLRQGRRIIGRA